VSNFIVVEVLFGTILMQFKRGTCEDANSNLKYNSLKKQR